VSRDARAPDATLGSTVRGMTGTPTGRMSVMAAARRCGIHPQTIYSRLRAKWPVRRLLEQPRPSGVFISEFNTTHGMSHHAAYKVWCGMIQRCRNPNNIKFDDYGGRGIRVCPAWKRFESFWRDMGPSYRRGLSIDRRNNNRGYNKANCRWTTRKVQQANRRNSKTSA
jgi:hypothetical protein